MTEYTQTPEQEMREIFASTLSAISHMRDKVISTVVDHSRTARELVALRDRFDEIVQRMDSVVQEAQKIRQDLHLVMVERDKYKKDSEDNLALAQSYEKERDEARTTNHDLQRDLGQAKNDLAELQRQVNHNDALVNRLRSDLEWTGEDRNRWRTQADEAVTERNKAQAALKEANERLTRIQDSFRSVFPEAPKAVSEPVELPGTAPSFRQEETKVMDVLPHPVQSVGEGSDYLAPVNERIDNPVVEGEQKPWWEDKKRETGF